MIYHYDPILGLQYYFVEHVILDLEMLPVQEFYIDKWMELFNKMGTLFVNSEEPASEITPTINTNAISSFTI